MIVSASRRCDLPAYRMDWLLERLREGFCEVRDPFDARRIRRVELAPDSVDCLVFWTRDPRGLAARARELEAMGHRFYVQVTITGYPAALEPGVLRAPEAVRAFSALSDAIGPERTLWRYDPVIVSGELTPDWQLRGFASLAASLQGRTTRVTVSLLDEYARTRARLERAGFGDAVFGSRRDGAGPAASAQPAREEFALEAQAPPVPPEPYPRLLTALAAEARARGIEPRACAEPFDLSPFGLQRGACVDADLMEALFGRRPAAAKDPGQRTHCACAASVDIGEYSACPARCAYCYARR